MMGIRLTTKQARAYAKRHPTLAATIPDFTALLTSPVTSDSPGEDALAQQLAAVGIAFEREFAFHPTRKWRADFRLQGFDVLVEVEGGVHAMGRHQRPKGFQADLDKYNAAATLGWTVLRFSTADVRSGDALSRIQEVVCG